jgi:hypothetical protein
MVYFFCKKQIGGVNKIRRSTWHIEDCTTSFCDADALQLESQLADNRSEFQSTGLLCLFLGKPIPQGIGWGYRHFVHNPFLHNPTRRVYWKGTAIIAYLRVPIIMKHSDISDRTVELGLADDGWHSSRRYNN